MLGLGGYNARPDAYAAYHICAICHICGSLFRRSLRQLAAVAANLLLKENRPKLRERVGMRLIENAEHRRAVGNAKRDIRLTGHDGAFERAAASPEPYPAAQCR